VTNGVQDQYTEPLVTAYRVLYEIARDQGQLSAALKYHEKYAQADKGYLDDISARQIAYEKVKHEILARQLQIDALNRQNEILQLERENNRLYIALLISILAFIGLWAYKTKRLQMHFMRLSQKDGLTGIANRPHFLSRAEQLLESNRKSGQELCIVLCDLDYFKAINDRYGHATGDFVLKRTVDACQSHLRPADLFGRFGGEEFGIVLAGCELAVARERCEQLRAAVESITAPEFGMHSNVTASFGVASAKASGYELRLLLAHADSALYQAKREGRNCVVVYDRNHGADSFSGTGSTRADVA
jgi:diguanylate cyclase (GGDEF)-like protein